MKLWTLFIEKNLTKKKISFNKMLKQLEVVQRKLFNSYKKLTSSYQSYCSEMILSDIMFNMVEDLNEKKLKKK